MIIKTTSATLDAAFASGRNFSGSDFETYCRERMADFCSIDNPDLPDTACEKCNECPFIEALKAGYNAR